MAKIVKLASFVVFVLVVCFILVFVGTWLAGVVSMISAALSFSIRFGSLKLEYDFMTDFQDDEAYDEADDDYSLAEIEAIEMAAFGNIATASDKMDSDIERMMTDETW